MPADVSNSAQLGLTACLSFVIGNIIGSGIFITPGEVLKLSGSIGLDLLIWALCGIFTLLGAIVFVELGTAIPSDGGDFAYCMFVKWKSLAFSLMFIAAFISYPGAGAIQATSFGQYMVIGIETFWNPGKLTPYIEWSLGAFLLVVCTFVNCFPVGKGATAFQVTAVYAKAIILLTVVCVGIFHFFMGDAENIKDPFKGSNYNTGALALACYSSLWSFAGWDILNAGAPSVKNPRRTLPFALIGGLIFVTVIYLLTNLSFCIVLGTDLMKESPAVAADFAKKSMGKFYHFIPFATALLLLSTVNGCIFALSRIIAKAAEEGHLPLFLAARHKDFKTPVPALVTQLILTLFMTVFSISTIINYASVVMWGQKTLSVAALLYIRYYKMDVNPGVLRVPLIFTVTFFILSFALTIFPAFTDTEMFLIGSGTVAILSCFYAIFHRIQSSDWLKASDRTVALFVCNVFNSELPQKMEAVLQREVGEQPDEEEELLTP